MKKVLLLTSLVTMASLGAFAQGKVNANNSGSGIVLQIQDSAHNGGQAVTVGSPATAAGFGAGAGPGQVSISMYIAPAGTSLAALEASTPVWTGFNSANGTVLAAQGTFAPGNPFTLPTLAAYDGSAPVEFIFFGTATVNGLVYSGWTDIATVTPATGTGTAPSLWGTGPGQISSFVLTVSESTTIALGGLGAAALLLFRRRK